MKIWLTWDCGDTFYIDNDPMFPKYDFCFRLTSGYLIYVVHCIKDGKTLLTYCDRNKVGEGGEFEGYIC